MTERIIINKKGSSTEGKQTVPSLIIKYSDLKENIQTRTNTSISELSVAAPLSFDRQKTKLTVEDKVSKFLFDYEEAKDIMTQTELINHFKRVKLDVPAEYFKTDEAGGGKKKTKALYIDYSQGVSISNKYSQNGYLFPLFFNPTQIESHRPYTITTWIKPTEKVHKTKYIFRHYIRLIKDDYVLDTLTPFEENWILNTEKFSIGMLLRLNKNGKIVFSHHYLNNNSNNITYDTLSWDSTNISLGDIRYNEWNKIDFGIDQNRKMFIRLNNGTRITNDEVLPSDSVDLKTFLNLFMKENNTTIFDEIIKTGKIYKWEEIGHAVEVDVSKTFVGLRPYGTFNIEDFYFEFPQFLIGGIENRSNDTYSGKIVNTSPRPQWLTRFVNTWYTISGLSSFYISSLRYYDDELSDIELTNESFSVDLKNDYFELNSKCTLNHQFDEVLDNKLKDRSVQGNTGYLIGDRKYIIANTGEDAILAEKFNPIIKDVEGPF